MTAERPRDARPSRRPESHNRLGTDVAVVTSTGPNGMPPYLISDSGGSAEPVVVFFYHGHWSEFPAWAAIAPHLARRAMQHFLHTGELLSEVAWREV